MLHIRMDLLLPLPDANVALDGAFNSLMRDMRRSCLTPTTRSIQLARAFAGLQNFLASQLNCLRHEAPKQSSTGEACATQPQFVARAAQTEPTMHELPQVRRWITPVSSTRERFPE